MKYDFRDGHWSFEDDSMIVHVDQATYQRHITEQLEKKGLPAQLSPHLHEYKPLVTQQRIAVAKELRNPAYWQKVTDANVRIYPKGRTIDGLSKPSPKPKA